MGCSWYIWMLLRFTNTSRRKKLLPGLATLYAAVKHMEWLRLLLYLMTNKVTVEYASNIVTWYILYSFLHMNVRGCTKAAHIYYYWPMCQWKIKPTIQMHSYIISLCNSYCHLVNVTEYMCFFSASCFHLVTLDLTVTEDLTGLTNLMPLSPQMGVCIH